MEIDGNCDWVVLWHDGESTATATHMPTGVRFRISPAGWVLVDAPDGIEAKLRSVHGTDLADRMLRSLMEDARALIGGSQVAMPPNKTGTLH